MPYDVYNREEACEVVRKNPGSFLAIDRAETSFPKSVSAIALSPKVRISLGALRLPFESSTRNCPLPTKAFRSDLTLVPGLIYPKLLPTLEKSLNASVALTESMEKAETSQSLGYP